ncbi:MAG TPA: GDP-mannose 4,6-dehydratase [Myxococcota bacterium]|nr:GDP-mannose 4,6-dehydratase [Myxococcota bacterium]
MAKRSLLRQPARVRVAVTGAGGFVGTKLVARLEAAGHQVHASDRELDVGDLTAVRAALLRERPEAVVHLAALSSVTASVGDPSLTWRVNYLGARAVLETARELAPGAVRPVRVLLVGSGQVYGSAAPGALPFDEAAPLRPRSPYDWTKAAADLLGGVHAAAGADVMRVRPFNHTGPGQSDAFVASSFARQLAEIELGRRPAVLSVGNLDSVRDFLDVDDVLDAYLALLDPRVPAGIYNVASGRGLAMRELLELLLAASGVRPAITADPSRLRRTDASVGDASRLREATGWRPRRDLGDTLKRLLDDWRRRLRDDA